MPRIFVRTTATVLVAAIAVASCSSSPAGRRGGARTQVPPSAAAAAEAAIAGTSQPPTAALPAAADLGADYAVVGDRPAEAADFDTNVSCPATADMLLHSRDLYRAGISRLFDAPRGHYDAVDVHQYRATGAEMAMREVRERIRRCALVEVRLDEDKTGRVEWKLLADDFAGDDSVMVRYRIRESGRVINTDYRLIVRQRDMVTDAWFSDQRWTRTQLNAVAVRLAQRMCAASRGC